MGKRISRCVELLEQDQSIYYDGPHSGHELTRAQGRIDAGPTRSGHHTPTVIVEAPVNGIDAAHVRYNA